VSVFTLDNPALLVAAAITFGFGFWEYIYSFRLVSRESKAPFPIWMHTFYFAHDSTWAVIFLTTAPRYGWHWFMVAAGIALIVWTVFELYNFVMAVKLERQEIFGHYTTGAVSVRTAVVGIVVQVLAFYGLVNVLILFMGQGSFLQWAALTNLVMAAGPGTLWLRRRSREGGGMGIALVIVAGTLNTFLPTGMFVLALPEVFNQPWFYLTGAIFTGIATAWAVMVWRFDPKPAPDDRRRPIW
jgi:hypothetical protein